MSLEPIEFFVAGDPKGQPRAKAFHRGGFTKMYDPGTADHWKALIMQEMKARGLLGCVRLGGPMRVDLTFFFPRPKKHFHTSKARAGQLRENAPYWHTSKPDRDNSDKAALDCLTTLDIWTDDCIVCDGRIQKRYANGSAGCRFKITEATE